MNPQGITITLSLADLDKIRDQVASKQRDIDALHDDLYAARAELAGKKLPGEPTVTISASQFWEAFAETMKLVETHHQYLRDPMKPTEFARELAQKLGLEAKP